MLDYCSAVYCGLLNGVQKARIECVQKLAVAIVMGTRATSYASGLRELGLTTLEDRRLWLAKKFALSALHNPRFTGWFVKTPTPVRLTRQVPRRFIIPDFGTKRAEGSPIGFLTTLLNEMSDLEITSGILTSQTTATIVGRP